MLEMTDSTKKKIITTGDNPGQSPNEGGRFVKRVWAIKGTGEKETI